MIGGKVEALFSIRIGERFVEFVKYFLETNSRNDEKDDHTDGGKNVDGSVNEDDDYKRDIEAANDGNGNLPDLDDHNE